MRVTQFTMRRRFALLLLCLLLAVFALVARLAVVQVVQAPQLQKLAADQVSLAVPVQGVRGTIFDAEGDPLVYTATAPTLMAVPAQVVDKNGAARALAGILHMPAVKILTLLQKKTRIVYLSPGGKRLSAQQVRQVNALHVRGLYLTEDGKPAYPFGSLAAQVLGITGSENQGLTGVELEYNAQLTGRQGYITFPTNAKGQRLPGGGEEYIPPQNGEDVQLTLNGTVQQIVQREMEQAVAEYNPNEVTAIVEDPQTGSILAMANYPTFDPANWRSYPASTYNHNLAIWKTFEPGSTFKIVTLSTALQQHKVNLADKFYDPGYYEVAGHKIRCWKAGGHGSESFLNVVENSCNPGFIAMGERIGKTALFQSIRAFGFGSKTGIDLPGEGNGILFPLAKVGPLELATTAFGQGVSVTPIQQVMAMGTVANGGLLMKPYVVEDFRNHDSGQVLRQTQPLVVRRVISAQTAAQVRSALESVVAQGTGGGAYFAGYRVAGKTGTAQVAENGHYSGSHYVVSFIGMAPANHPQLVAYLAIDYPRPKAGVVFGGVIAAPIVGRILGDSLQALDVPTSAGGIAKRQRYPDPVQVAIPNLTGLSLQDAKNVAIESGLQLRTQLVGSGHTVLWQSPQAGTQVPEGSTLRLFLGDLPSSPASDVQHGSAGRNAIDKPGQKQ